MSVANLERVLNEDPAVKPKSAIKRATPSTKRVLAYVSTMLVLFVRNVVLQYGLTIAAITSFCVAGFLVSAIVGFVVLGLGLVLLEKMVSDE